jgi:hypothetical protein
MRAGDSVARAASPGGRGTGSHTSVTFVFPPAPRSVPIHVRTSLDRDGTEMDARAVDTAFGGSGFGGAVARFASSVVKAQ